MVPSESSVQKNELGGDHLLSYTLSDIRQVLTAFEVLLMFIAFVPSAHVETRVGSAAFFFILNCDLAPLDKRQGHGVQFRKEGPNF